MTIKLGDVETTALIPVVIKASESLRKNPRVRDEIAVEMIQNLGIDTVLMTNSCRMKVLLHEQ